MQFLKNNGNRGTPQNRDFQPDFSPTPTAKLKLTLQETGKPPKNGAPLPITKHQSQFRRLGQLVVVLKATEKSRRTGKIMFPQCQSFQSLFTCATTAVSMQSPAQLSLAQIMCFFQGLMKLQGYLICYYIFQNREVRNRSKFVQNSQIEQRLHKQELYHAFRNGQIPLDQISINYS